MPIEVSFRTVYKDIYTKCSNKDYTLISSLVSVTSGLLNISDNVLVSLDILSEWREHFKRGSPISNVIDSKVSFLASKSQVRSIGSFNCF